MKKYLEVNNQNKILVVVLIFISLFQFKIHAQVDGDLNTISVSELDAIQLPSGTWIAASMENLPPNDPDLARGVIYRSIDNGFTWSPVDSLESDIIYDAVADPVISIDNQGNAYLLVMRRLISDPLTVHLILYRSEDDGLSWSIISQPYIDDKFSDTPHLLIDDLNRFFISYTEFSFPPLTGLAHFIKSEDGGLTWTNPTIFESLETDNVLGAYLNFSEGGQINLVYNDYSSPFTYYTSSGDNGNSWNEIIEFPGTIEFSVNKIVSNKNYETICVLTHEAHNPTSGIYYNYSLDNGQSWDDYLLSNNSSMAEGIMDNDGIVHITYNQFIGDQFLLNYVYSTDGGVTFSNPLTLYSGQTYIDITSPSIELIAGESQSMILGNDSLIHLTFVDWSDFSKAKHLIFEPYNILSSIQNPESINEHNISLFPNPAYDYLNISLGNNNQFSIWSINTVKGERIDSGNFNINSNLKVNISNLETGIYLLNIESDTHVVVKKFIKK